MLKFIPLLVVLLVPPAQLVAKPKILLPFTWTARQIWTPGETEANVWVMALIAARTLDRHSSERAFAMGWTESSPLFPMSSVAGRSAVGFSITFGETVLVRRMMKSSSPAWRTLGLGYALGRVTRESIQAWQNYRLVSSSIGAPPPPGP